MKKRFLAILLSLCMTASMLPVEVFAIEEDTSNEEDPPYRAEEVTVESEPSDMADEAEDAGVAARTNNASVAYPVTGGNLYFDINTGTITDCDPDVTAAAIPRQINGTDITAIGDSAFELCSSLASVTIPDSVISIGNRAFSCCASLTSVTIPNSVTALGDRAFEMCYSLTNVTIPDGVTSIGDYTFQGCSGLTSMTIPNSVASVGRFAFSACEGLTSMVIPSSVTSIGWGAFDSCSGLTSVTIPSSVTSIGERAFSGCSGLTSAGPIGGNYSYKFGWTDSIPANAFFGGSNLTSVTIPESVTSIGDSAFNSCSSLTSVTIPDGVASIGERIFQECSGLTSVTIPSGVAAIGDYAFAGCSNLSSLTIPNGVTSIGSYTFSGCSSLSSLTVPGSISSIGLYAFFGCSSLTSAGPIGGNYSYRFGWTTEIPAYAFYECRSLTNATIPNGVTSIGANAFYNCSGLTHVTIPGSVTSIVGAAFYGCSGLTSAGPIGGGYHYEFGWTTEIPAGAFSDFNSLTSVTIPDGVTSIGGHAFSWCTGLTSVTIPDGVTAIEEYTFAGCSSLSSLTVSSSVTSIGLNAFSGCSSLTSAGPIGGNYSYKFGWTAEIPNWAFLGCTGLTSVTIPDGVTSIGNNAFRGCSSLIDVTISDSVTSIGEYAFAECSGLTDVTIPNGVISIERYTFSGCSSLIDADISDSVTSIGEYAFSGCSSLTSVTIPNSVTSIGEYAFSDCSGLTSAFISTNVTSIERYTFSGCSSLADVIMSFRVTSIEDDAFSGCSSLTDVYYSGDMYQWNLISIDRSEDSTNRPLLDATIHYNDTGNLRTKSIKGILRQGEGYQMKWRCDYRVGTDDQIIYAKIRIYITAADKREEELYVYNEAVATGLPYPWEMEPYNIPKSSVTSLTIEGNSQKLLTIPGNAFREYSNLQSVTLTNIFSIDAGALSLPKDSLTNLTIKGASQKLLEIPENAFRECSELKYVSMDNVSTIGTGAFSGCAMLGNVVFPQQTLKKIGEDAFKGTNLSSITLDEAVTQIGDTAFSGCKNLIIRCYKNSAAYRFAYFHDIQYILLDGGDLTKILVPFEAADKDISMEITWTPETMFSPTSTRYDNDLAIAGLVLSGAAEKGQDRIDTVLAQMGFGKRQHFDYPEDWNLGVAFSLADQKITINGKTKTLVACVVRGTTTKADGIRDVAALVDGFLGDVPKVMTPINASYLDQYPKEDLIFFVTGHSLGAAVSGRVAEQLSNQLPEGSVFSYNYATARNKLLPYIPGAKRPTAIYNIINTEDLVPYLPPNYLTHIGEDRNCSTNSDRFTSAYERLAGCLPDLKCDWGQHLTDRYMALLLANDAFTATEEFSHRLIKVFCPVDVEVVDANGTIVARTKDNVADDTITSDRAFVYIQDDEKYIYLFDDGDYTIRMTGTGNGVLNYSVEDIAADGSVLSEKEYPNVELTRGKKLISEVGGTTETPAVKLLVVDDGGQPVREVLPDGKGTEVPVSSSTHSMIKIEEKAATCKNTGIKAHWHCSVCNKNFADAAGTTELSDVTTPIDATNHVGGTEIRDAKEATYVAEGYTGDTYCLGCGAKIADGTVIPKKTRPSGGGGGGISTYAITVNGTKDGRVTADRKSAAQGETVTLTVASDKGYTLETLTVTDKNGDNVKIAEKNGKYTFTMPASKVTVKATFMEDNSMFNFFVDVPADAYYHDAVLWAVEKIVTGGTTATTFSPNVACTRAQAVTFLWRAAGSPIVNYAMNFTDVPADAYYAEAVRWAVSQGITSGASATTFNPNGVCTRAQIVTFLWRSQKSPAANSVNSFIDVAADAYYANAVLWAAENGITGGTTATTFSPNSDCTRAQIVTFLWRCMK